MGEDLAHAQIHAALAGPDVADAFKQFIEVVGSERPAFFEPLVVEHAGGALAQQKQVWKATDVHPLGYPTVEAIVRMGKKLETATGGRLSIQMYPSMQLGGEKEMIEQAQVGALQIARISVGAMGPVVDDLNVFNLPFVFRDEAHMRKVIDGPIGQELLDRVSSAPTSRLIVLGWMDAGTRNVYSNKPVTKPEDLKGQKIRMMGNPIFVETMNAMGGNGVAMGFNELYGAQVFDEPAVALAPTPYAKWLTCRVAMEEYGHHVRFRELGEKIGIPQAEMMPAFKDYEQKTTRRIPVVLLERV